MTLHLATIDGVAIARPTMPIGFLRDALHELQAGERPDRQRIAALAREMAIRPARTLDDIRCKSAAVRIAYFGDSYFEPLDFDTPIGRLFVSLLHDLEKISTERLDG